VIEVVLEAEGHERRMVAFLRAAPDGAEHHWCPIPVEGRLGMADSLIFDMRPCMPHWNEDEFKGGIDVELVELSARGKHAVEVRRQDGSCGGYPRDSIYTTEYWELQGDELVRIFGPFTTYSESHSAEPEAPWEYGELRLSGGFPRQITTTSTVDWSIDDGSEDDPDGEDARVLSSKRTWRYRGGRYR
jgi:hypothetical protein